MKFRLTIGALALATVGFLIGCNPTVALYAQSVPATVHASFDPNPAGQNVIQYKVSLDGGTPTVFPATSCTPTNCLAPVTVPTFGNHVVTVVAENLLLSGDPTSVQDSPASNATFSLNQAPTATTTTKVVK